MGHNRKERPRPRRSPNSFAVFKKNSARNLANDVLAPTAKEKRGQRLISFQGRYLHGHQPSEGFDDVFRRSSDHACAPGDGTGAYGALVCRLRSPQDR